MIDWCQSCGCYAAEPGHRYCHPCMIETIDISKVTFICLCGNECYVEYDSAFCDSLDYHCPHCGEYYKKSIRIEPWQRLKEESEIRKVLKP